MPILLGIIYFEGCIMYLHGHSDDDDDNNNNKRAQATFFIRFLPHTHLRFSRRIRNPMTICLVCNNIIVMLSL
jgi:hypothetical protein